MQIIFVSKLKVTLNSICLKQADNSFYTIISLTGPKQNKDFISQELQILICKFLMKQIVTCQICSHHRISYTSLIFIARFQNWFLQQKTSLPLWKTNSPILMYMHLLHYREENFFSYQTNYDLVDRSLDSLEFPTRLSCKIKMRPRCSSCTTLVSYFFVCFSSSFSKTKANWRLIRLYKNLCLWCRFKIRSEGSFPKLQ